MTHREDSCIKAFVRIITARAEADAAISVYEARVVELQTALEEAKAMAESAERARAKIVAKMGAETERADSVESTKGRPCTSARTSFGLLPGGPRARSGPFGELACSLRQPMARAPAEWSTPRL